MTKLHALTFAGLLLGATALPAAAADPVHTVVDAERSFDVQRATILKAMDDGKTYVELSRAEREQVRDSLELISRLLAGKPGVDALSEPDKVKLFNEQEAVNARLTRAHADSRLVCTREKRVGSHRATNVCYTVAERRRMREQTLDAMTNSRGVKLPVLK